MMCTEPKPASSKQLDFLDNLLRQRFDTLTDREASHLIEFLGHPPGNGSRAQQCFSYALLAKLDREQMTEEIAHLVELTKGNTQAAPPDPARSAPPAPTSTEPRPRWAPPDERARLAAGSTPTVTRTRTHHGAGSQRERTPNELNDQSREDLALADGAF